MSQEKRTTEAQNTEKEITESEKKRNKPLAVALPAFSFPPFDLSL
jgi:hypothetical protein